MSVRLGIVMDPIARINFKKDSSLAMLLAAQACGWSLFYMEQQDLYQKAGVARGRMRPLKVFNDASRWFELEAESDQPLHELDVILMRKDPPFDNEFVYSTYLLEQAERAGALVVNRPQSLRDCNEKFFATQFTQCTPPTMVSRRSDILREFAAEHRDIILKPLDGMGGSSIFRHREGDPNLSVILETLTQHGSQQIMAQRYLPEIKDGDKRILMIDGEPVPYCLARIPAQGETAATSPPAARRGPAAERARPLDRRRGRPAPARARPAVRRPRRDRRLSDGNQRHQPDLHPRDRPGLRHPHRRQADGRHRRPVGCPLNRAGGPRSARLGPADAPRRATACPRRGVRHRLFRPHRQTSPHASHHDPQ